MSLAKYQWLTKMEIQCFYNRLRKRDLGRSVYANSKDRLPLYSYQITFGK